MKCNKKLLDAQYTYNRRVPEISVQLAYIVFKQGMTDI